jgi:alkanesulfonate monooxygenase SsuD/methylene tetrahydromethanopterin reductase-like flavin-dependent oxidoreductase (luciferase family)
MQFGMSVPNFDVCGDPHTATELARIAEDSGWDGFFLWDHVLWTKPHIMPASDPYMLLAAMATVTSRIKLGAMITPVPRRRPWNLARQMTTLDHLSDGRAILGVGIGGDWFGDYSKFGEASPDDQKAHGEMLDEGLQVITGLWSGEPFSFEGEHYHIKEAQFLPKPAQQPRIPIWVAGVWPNKKPFRRAAQWDGVFPIVNDQDGQVTAAQVRDVIAYIMQFRESSAPFDVVAEGRSSGTDHEEDRERVAALEAAGATWWMESRSMPMTLEDLRTRLKQGPPHG